MLNVSLRWLDGMVAVLQRPRNHLAASDSGENSARDGERDEKKEERPRRTSPKRSFRLDRRNDDVGRRSKAAHVPPTFRVDLEN